MSDRSQDSSSQPVQGRPEVSAAPDQTGPSRSSGADTQTRPAPQRLDRLPLYRVILHNDDVNDIVDVVEAICDLTPLNLQRAAAATIEAHNTGLALLLTTHRERAELYVEQFHSKKLTVTIEAAT